MASALAVLADAASEGRDVVLSMLVVGLVFLLVIALGELNEWRVRVKHRNAARRGPVR
jgi:hypothetical protein